MDINDKVVDAYRDNIDSLLPKLLQITGKLVDIEDQEVMIAVTGIICEIAGLRAMLESHGESLQ